MRTQIAVFLTILLCSIAWGQSTSSLSNSAQSDQSMPGMDMSHHDMSNMKDMPMGDTKADGEASAHVMHSMEGHMDMGPHMKMTPVRKLKPGDSMRAQQVADEARKAAEKYKDYHVALNDGFKIFMPNVPQKVYHFTSRGNAVEAEMRFDPEHPTSLLYEKHGDDYKLIGVMYTAPKTFTEDQLDEPAIRNAWINRQPGCMRRSRRKIHTRRFQLDGARVSLRKRSGEHLVS